MTLARPKLSSGVFGSLMLAGLLGAAHEVDAQPEITQRAEWTVSSSETTRFFASLAVPETDNLWITLSCQTTGSPTLVTIEPFVVLQAPPETTPAARFVVDGREFIRGLRMTGYDGRLEGYLFETVVEANDPLLRAMQEGRSLIATVHPNQGTDPPENTALVGSNTAIETLLNDCATRRP